MTSAPAFRPKGDRPEWRMIYDELLVGAEFNEVIAYDDLDRVLGCPFAENRSPFYRARQHLSEMRLRWLEAEPGVGYRVIDANEHIDAAQRRKRRAKKQLETMVKIAQATDLVRLTPGEMLRFDTQSRINAALYMVAVHHEQRLQRIEQILKDDGKL